MGENAQIFETLTSKLRFQLPQNYDYVFVDASTESIAAPGLSDLFPGPYYCHGQTFDTKCIAEQHEYLTEIIEDEGPFDGVFAFSQGAAVVASLALHHALEKVAEPPLFKFAVFFCGTLPFSKDVSLGRDETVGFGKTTADMALKLAEANPEAWNEIQDSMDEPSGKCFQFIPQETTIRVPMPTVHVFDPSDIEYLRIQHTQLVKLSRMAKVIHHGDGHAMPQGKKDISATAAAIREIVEQSALAM